MLRDTTLEKYPQLSVREVLLHLDRPALDMALARLMEGAVRRITGALLEAQRQAYDRTHQGEAHRTFFPWVGSLRRSGGS